MTVCIGTICSLNERTIVVGAADRLVTYGDIEYEQPTPKIIPLATHTVAMISGSPEDHTEIAYRTIERLRISTTPITVELVAKTYADEFSNLRRDRAAKKHLAPLGLNIWNFLSNQIGLTEGMRDRLVSDMAREQLGSSAIIAGVDGTAAHLYVVRDPGVATCFDQAGWAAVGYGSRHADSQFISEDYSSSWRFEDALLLTYLAKKSADITPGVGASTDVFWIAESG